jgi:hypothetical protein
LGLKQVSFGAQKRILLLVIFSLFSFLVFVSAASALPSDKCNLSHPKFFVDARSHNHLVQKLRQVRARVACKIAMLLLACPLGAELELFWLIWIGAILK